MKTEKKKKKKREIEIEELHWKYLTMQEINRPSNLKRTTIFLGKKNKKLKKKIENKKK